MKESAPATDQAVPHEITFGAGVGFSARALSGARSAYVQLLAVRNERDCL